MLTRTRHAADLPPPHRLADETLLRRWSALIEQGIVRVQEARQRGFSLYQQAIVELDRILLSDEISAQEADLIVEQAAHTGLLAHSQDLYRQYETRLEQTCVSVLFGSEGASLFREETIAHPYLLRYRRLVGQEVHLAGIGREDYVLFLGSGPFPLSAIELARQAGCHVDCVEPLPEQAEMARRVMRQLELDEHIHVFTAEGQAFPAKKYSVVLVGVFAQPKQDMLEHVEAECGEGTRVLVRTTSGLRQFIYPQAQFVTTRLVPRDSTMALGDQVLSTILLQEPVVDALPWRGATSPSPLRVRDAEALAVADLADPANPGLYYALRGFEAVRDQGGQVKHFVSIGVGTGLDAIAAMESFLPERVTVTDVVATAIQRAKEMITHYQEQAGAHIPVAYLVGNLCEPLSEDEKADVIYAHLPHLPMAPEPRGRGIPAAPDADTETISVVPELINRYLLALHYTFLQQARTHLTPNGQVLLNFGLHVPLDIVEALFASTGYTPQVVFFGLTLQTRPFDTIPQYAKYESKGIAFAFYPYGPVLKQVLGKEIPDVTELVHTLEPWRMSATAALHWLRKTLYVKPFLGQFESKRKISRKKRERNAFNKA
jgi:methylase of polypeptide subunit release factors